MAYYEEVRAAETEILKADLFGYLCEVVEVDGHIVLYADGYHMGELWAEENAEDYISQIKEILQ